MKYFTHKLFIGFLLINFMNSIPSNTLSKLLHIMWITIYFEFMLNVSLIKWDSGTAAPALVRDYTTGPLNAWIWLADELCVQLFSGKRTVNSVLQQQNNQNPQQHWPNKLIQ